MRNLCTFFALIIACASSAQLINGSFEDGGLFSLAGWEWTCAAPAAVSDPAPGCGSWAASLQMGDPLGCDPSYLFQRIPFAQSGDQWELSGWVRSNSTGWGTVPRFGFSSVDDGVFAFQNQIGSAAPEWVYCYVIDTVHASATDTAVVLLTCGSVDGGVNASGSFDGMALDHISTGIALPAIELHTFIDDGQVLYIAVGDHAISNAQLLDPMGRALATRSRFTGTGSVAIGIDALPGGVYIVQAITDAGRATARFVKQ